MRHRAHDLLHLGAWPAMLRDWHHDGPCRCTDDAARRIGYMISLSRRLSPGGRWTAVCSAPVSTPSTIRRSAPGFYAMAPARGGVLGRLPGLLRLFLRLSGGVTSDRGVGAGTAIGGFSAGLHLQGQPVLQDAGGMGDTIFAPTTSS